MKYLLTIAFVTCGSGIFAQNVGIGTTTPNANAILELNSPNKAFLMPRVSDVNMNAMASPATGMMLYNTNLGRAYMYVGTWKQMMLEGDPFSLPYSGAGSSGAALFGIAQTDPSGTAGAIFGNNTQGGYGVQGNSVSGNGIVGVSNTGTGGRFSSTSGRALIAAGSVWLNNGGGKTMIGNQSAPFMQLHVSNATDSTLLQLDNNTALANGTNVGLYLKNGDWFTGAVKTTGTGTSTARLSFWTFANTVTSGLKERMSITDNGNVGINTTTPASLLDVNGAGHFSANVDIDGTVTINGGSPGAGKVLTSDAVGTASWKGMTGFAARKTGVNQSINASSSATISFQTEEYDLGTAGYNPATGEYTVPETGVYHIDISLVINPQVNPQGLVLNLTNNGTTIRQKGIQTTNVFSGTGLDLSTDVQLTQGDLIKCVLGNFSSTNSVIVGYQFASGSETGSVFSAHLIR